MALLNFSGIASGIDSSSLIKALLDQQRKARVKPLEDQISSLEDTNGAYSKLSELLSTLQSAASRFRTVNGGAVAKTATSSNESVASATASNSAVSGTYNLNVTSKARNASFSFDDRFASTDAVIKSTIDNGASAADRTVSFTTGQGAEAETVNVELTNTTTIGEFVSAYNSSATKSQASLVNVGTASSPSYAISISSLNEGEEEGFIADPVLGAELNDPPASPAVFQSFTRTQATNAQFTLDGVSGTIVRSSNTFNDVISGVTVTLNNTGAANITVGNDPDSTREDIEDFVEAFNAVVSFVKENDLVTRVEEGSEVSNVFGPLAKSSLDDNLVSALRQSLISAGTSGRTVNVLSDLGITTQRDGTLKLDADALTEALSSDSEGVRLITSNLGESLAAVDGTIAQFNRFNGLIDIAENGNSSQISDSQNRISEIEKALSKQEEALIARFSRLEGLIGQLNSQQSSLQSLFGG